MSDKHNAVIDALETLGTAPLPEGVGRDAIHLAVYPAVASERLLAGQDIYLLPDGRAAKGKDNALGIVDPFLKKSVQPGEKFWLVVYPRKITSLRHVWMHPGFDSEPVPAPISEEDKEMAKRVAERLTGNHEKWVRDFVSTLGTSISYEQVIERASEGDGYMSFGDDISGDIPDEFWNHVEVILGKKITERATYFTCAC